MDIATLGLRIDNGEIVKAKSSLESLTTVGASAETRLGSLKTAFVAAGVAAGAVAAGFIAKKVVEESIAAQNAMAQLEAVVKSTGGAAGFTVGQLDEMSIALQRQTVFSDEAVKGAQSMLLTFTQIRGTNFEKATSTVLDLATAMGGDLQGASIQVGKALNDPVKGMTALSRVGVTFSDSQEAVIKQLMRTGDVAGAQSVILAELTKEFGGSAKAARDTLGGALEALSNSFGDIFEFSRGASNGAVQAINALTHAIETSGLSMGKILTDATVDWETMSSSIRKTNAIMSLPIGPGFMEKARAINEKYEFELSVTIGKLREQAKAGGDVTKVVNAQADATDKLSAAQKRAAKEAEDQRNANEDMVRLAQQATDLTEFEGISQERMRIHYEATNKAIDAQRRLKGELLKETLEAIKSEEDLKLAGVERTAALKVENEAMQAARKSLDGFEEDVSSKLAHSLAKAFGDDSPLRGLFESLTKKLLSIWVANLVEPAAAAMMGIPIGKSGVARDASGGNPLGAIGQWGSTIATGAGVAVGAGAIGYGIGSAGGGNRGSSALGGAAAGAATGAMLAGPVGALVGGLAGAIGGFIGAGKAAREAAKNMEILQKSLSISMDALKADLAGDELGAGIAAINADREQRRQAYEEAYAGGKNERERYRLIAEMNALEDQRIAKLKEAVALQLREVTEDVRIQIMRNNGQTEAADALAIQVDQERRLAALRKQGVDDATIAALRESETAKAEADKNAVAAAEAIAAAAKAAQEAAEAAEKAFNQARAVEDLNVELLRAKGQGGAADDLAFQLEQQRRLEDAQKNQSQSYVDKLKELQQIQRDQRAAQQLIDSTGGAAAGGGRSGGGATQALTAVSAVVTDRTALMLVDLTRSSVSYLAQIAQNTGANGAGGGGVHIVNHFGADIDQDVADRIIDQLEQKLDERFGDRQNRQQLYTGSVAR